MFKHLPECEMCKDCYWLFSLLSLLNEDEHDNISFTSHISNTALQNHEILAYSLTLPSHVKGKLWASRKDDKAIKIIIKTQILWWKTMEGKRRLRVRVRVKFFYSILNLPRLTHDVTCSRLCPDGKSMRRQCQMKTLLGSNHN